MFHQKTLSILLFMLSFSFTFATITDLPLSMMVPGKGFQVKSEQKSGSTAYQYKTVNAGDINGDGYEDILIGDPTYSSNRGIVYVIYGTPQASPPAAEFDFTNEGILDYLTTGFTIKGPAANSYFGYSVSSAGDVNHDTFSDIIIGAYGQESSQGAAYVIYGGAKSTLKNIDLSMMTTLNSLKGFMISGEAASDQFGFSVSSAGDFDNDGYDDIIIGAPQNANGAGAAYVIYGGSSLTNILLSLNPLDPATSGFMFSVEQSNSALGTVVSNAGDINGDFRGDIMIAAPNAEYNENPYSGIVFIIYGAEKSTLTPSTGFIVTGYTAGDRLGSSMSAAGDVNGDDFGDIIIGAPNQNSDQGVAYVIYGGPNLVDVNIGYVATDLRMLKDQEPSQEINHDGSRLLTSIPLDSLISADQGFAIIGEGSSTVMSFGSSVSSAGDVNGDGYDDIIIGATGDSLSKGKVYVLYGGSNLAGLELANTDLPQADIGYSIMGNVDGGGFGSSVASVTGFADNQKMKLLVSEKLTSIRQATSYILFPSALCVQNCEFCNLPGTCSKCSRGYWLKAGSTNEPDTCEVCPQGCALCTSNTACQACEIGYTLPKQNTLCHVVTPSKITPFYGSKRENATKDTFDGTSIVGAALSSGSSLPINFGLVAKILRNVKYLDVAVSTELQETFISWKVASGFLAAPKSWATKADAKALPVVFGRYGLAGAFLVNYWKPFVMTLIGLAVFAVFKGVEMVVYKGDKETLKSSIPRQLSIHASNFALTQVYSNLDDAILYFILDARSTKLDGGFGAFSLILAVVILLVGGAIVGAHIFLLKKYQSLKSLKTDPTQLQRFLYKYENVKLIFNDFKDLTFFTQSFLWIHVARSLISSFIFAILFGYPVVQLVFLLILNLSMIVFLFVKKSFKDFLSTFSQLFCEVVLLIAHICMLGLAIMDQNESYNIEAMKNLSRGVIVMNAILLIGCAILMIIGVLKSLYESYMAKKKAPSGLRALPKLQNSRLDSVDQSQLGKLSTGNYSVGQYETQSYLKTTGGGNYSAGGQYETYGNQTGGNYYEAEGGINNNPMEVFDLNSNSSHPGMVISNQQGHYGQGNYESRLESNNASFSYQADETMNTSNLNLLSNNNNSFARADSLLRQRRRTNNIKMPGGIQTNPRKNFENPNLTSQFENNNPRLPVANNKNYGSEFSPQVTRPQRRYDQS